MISGNLFHTPKPHRPANQLYSAGRLDKRYLRMCAAYRLVKRGRIGKDRALALIMERHSPAEEPGMKICVGLWKLPLDQQRDHH